MGQLIAKLMDIFGKQGKGRTVYPSDRFDPAPTWGSPDLGSPGWMRWGTSGSEGQGWALLAGSTVSPAPPPPPARSGSRASVRPKGAGLGQPPSSGSTPRGISCDCDFGFSSFP